MITRLISLTLLIILLPLIFLMGATIFLSDGWPIVYRQRRVGYRGKTFFLYKFRTMVRGAERLQRTYRVKNESTGPTFKIREDPRFTRIGKFLSHTGLDELPQLWNVARGEMAFIGPRPFPPEEEAKLLPWMKKRREILPGIISPAILAGAYHRDFTAWMRSDVDYSRNKGFLVDVGIVVRVIPFLLGLTLGEIQKK